MEIKTKGQLYQMHMDIQTMNVTVRFLLKGRIEDFYKEFGQRIKTILAEISRLQREYFVVEGNMIKTDVITIDGKEVRTELMNEGKTKQEFQDKISAYLQQPIITNASKIISLNGV